MVAHRRVDVAELNVLARERMHRDGRLSDEELVAGGRAYAVGDRAVARRNPAHTRIVNGSRGEVGGIDGERGSVRVRIGDDCVREVSSAYLEDCWLEHGYA